MSDGSMYQCTKTGLARPTAGWCVHETCRPQGPISEELKRGLSTLDGPMRCTCGVSPTVLTADQVIRTAALAAAVQLSIPLVASDGVHTDDVIRAAGIFEAYVRGET